MDPDKKVEKIKELRRNLYQSSQHPRHYQNEGEEFSTVHPNNIDSEVMEKKEQKKTEE